MYKYARLLVAVLFAAAASSSALAATQGLFRNPSLSKTELVFEYANDLWTSQPQRRSRDASHQRHWPRIQSALFA